MHLVAPTAAEDFAVRHILESLTLLEFLPRNATFADVGWKKAVMIDFGHNSFDISAANTILKLGYSLSGWMLYEVLPDMKGLEYEVKELAITIEDVAGDCETIPLSPIKNQEEKGLLLNPGDGFRLTDHKSKSILSRTIVSTVTFTKSA